ncbi:MAG: two-component system sensor histidine kinase NtrB, partial [Bradymonadaceae bacterium]
RFSELVFNAMEENVIVIDENLKIVKVNRAAMETYDGSLEGNFCHEVFAGHQGPCHGCMVPRAFATGETFRSEQVHLCNGKTEIMSFRGFPLHARANGKPDKLLLVSRAITEEKERELQMAHHEKVASFALLAAGVAHEIGNPLASIKTQLYMAQEQPDEPQVVEETLGVMASQVRRMEGLLRDMSGFARRRKQEANFICLNQVVKDAVRLLTHDPRSKAVSLTTDLEENLPAVHVDEDKALQVILNLGLNGIDAIGGKGTVRIETFTHGDMVGLRVQDSGDGVPAEIRARVFEPYFTTKPVGRGTGLGLFVSSRIAEEMGGHLAIEDVPSGEGASFIMTIPKANFDEPTHPSDRRRTHLPQEPGSLSTPAGV